MWIEFDCRLINLNHVEQILTDGKTIYVFFENGELHEKYDDPEKCRLRYIEIRELLLSKPCVVDLLSKSEKALLMSRAEVTE